MEDWQRELEEDDVPEKDPQTQSEEKGAELQEEEELKDGEDKEFTDESLALPFLSGISPAGFMSVDLKRPGQVQSVQVRPGPGLDLD